MKAFYTIMIIATILLSGCSDQPIKEESRIMDEPQISTINLDIKNMFYPSARIASYKGLIPILDVSTMAGNNTDGVLYCFDLANGKITWKKEIEKGYHGKLEYAGLDGNVYIKLDGKLTCLDLFTGKTIWQSKESIDWIEKSVDSRVFCVSTDENRRNDDTYRNLLCFDATNGKNIWSVEISSNFWSGYYSNDEVAYFDWLEDGRNLLVRDAKTGVQKHKIQGADMIGHNYDNQTNVLYRLWNDLFMHTPEKEVSLFRFGRIDKKIPAAAVVSEGKLLLETKENETQIIELETGKVLSTVPASIMQARIISGKACFNSSGKFNVYDPETGKLLWFLGHQENQIDEAVLVPVDDKTLSIHSMKDGSLVSQVKLDGKIYRSTAIEGFGFVVSMENGKVVLIKTVDSN